MSAYLETLSSASRTVAEDDVRSLVSHTMRKVERMEQTVLSRFLEVLLHQVLFILDEGAVACPHGGGWTVVTFPAGERDRRLPCLVTVDETHHGSVRHAQMMRELYRYEDRVAVEEGDIVVDVGAYVGGFSTAVRDLAHSIVCIEPNEAIDDSLRENLSEVRNATVVRKATWGEPDVVEINKSSDFNENSLLQPDSGSSGESFEVAADTVPNIVRECGHSHVDYLKIEAEGVEPEILRAALEDEMRIEKVAIDCSPERDGEDTVEEVCHILDAYGYESHTKQNADWWGNYIVFGEKV